MKQVYILFLFFLSIQTVQAQYVGDKLLSEIEEQYMYVTTSYSFQTGFFTAHIEYGPKNERVFGRGANLKETVGGKPVYFQSSMGVINYLFEKGFEIFHIVTEEGEIRSYILQKRKV